MKQIKNLGSWLNWTFGISMLAVFIILSAIINSQKERTASNVEVEVKGQFLSILAMQNFRNGRMFWMQNIQTKECFLVYNGGGIVKTRCS